MGEVCSSKVYRNGMTQTLERMLVHLCLESGEKVRLSAFDDHASSLEKVFSEKDGGTNILLATNLNPKLFGEEDLATTNQFADRLKWKAKADANPISSFHGVSKIEQVSIHDLNQFVATGNPQEVDFLCIATVTDIQTQHGWYFISCAACGTKMLQKSSSLTCNNYKCGSTTAVGDVKYRVELVVDVGITTGVFVAFDKDMVKLIKIQTSTLSSQMTDGELISDSYAPIPQKILDIVGKKFTFQIKLTDFNFTPHHQSFTVSRIYETIEVPPGPTFRQAQTGDNLNLGVTGCANIPTEPNLRSTSSAVDKTSIENTSGSG
ncbi:PREDICTED: uncharacterized protein LOC104734081 [Camelina sativa]|uniref:Uncharacterized protein LOC104734081 n=1 Tax=Camelina sativa TaxID=90675 RepID=A0ABM0V6Y4_CAMSA|nr:PREDICTED: uncharacterized protein LOC104734081 [Camelina sativa]